MHTSYGAGGEIHPKDMELELVGTTSSTEDMELVVITTCIHLTELEVTTPKDMELVTEVYTKDAELMKSTTT